MTDECVELIVSVAAGHPLAILNNVGMWHVRVGNRAVAIDDDLDDSGEDFTLNRLRSDDADEGGNGTWEFDGEPEYGTADEVLRMANAWLG